MTRFFLLIIILSLGHSSCRDKYKIAPNDGILVTDTAFIYPVFYDFEQFHGLVDDSLPDGKWIGYYLDKKTIAFIGFYKNGKPNGLFQHFLKNGRIYHTCVYKNGKEDGPFTFWHEKNSTISMIGFEKADKDDGEWYDWWSNGQLRRHYFFKDGVQDGLDCYYDTLGNIEWMGYYSKGYEIGIWNYYKNNKPTMIRIYADSITSKELAIAKKYDVSCFPKGDWITYDEKGNIQEKVTFDTNYAIKSKTEYLPDGKIKSEKSYNGELNYYCRNR